MFRNNPEKVESFIGAESDFQGEFVVKGTLMIAGRVDGLVKADCVIVSETSGEELWQIMLGKESGSGKPG